MSNQIENHLLKLMPRAPHARVLRMCEEVELEQGQILTDVGQTIRYAYFPMSGWISFLSCDKGRPDLQVAMAGREGMVGSSISIGIQAAPLRTVVRSPGQALRVDARAYRSELDRNPALMDVSHRYLRGVMKNLATCAACSQFHEISKRVARWLLAAQDRQGQNSLNITHARLAQMLGVRRASVSIVASDFEKQGLIEGRRGAITVLKRRALEQAACICRKADWTAFRELAT